MTNTPTKDAHTDPPPASKDRRFARVASILALVLAVPGIPIGYLSLAHDASWWPFPAGVESSSTPSPSTSDRDAPVIIEGAIQPPNQGVTPSTSDQPATTPTPSQVTPPAGGPGGTGTQTSNPTTAPVTQPNPYGGPATLSLASPLTGPGDAQWYTQDNGANGCKYASDGYHVYGSSDYQCHSPLSLVDFTLEVTISLAPGKGTGLTFRDRDRNGLKWWYRVYLDADGTVILRKMAANMSTKLQEVAIGASTQRTLAITAVGSNISVFADRQASPVLVFNDSEITTSGEIGLMAIDCCSTEAVYTNARIWI